MYKTHFFMFLIFNYKKKVLEKRSDNEILDFLNVILIIIII